MNLYYLSNVVFFGFAIYSVLFLIFKHFSFYKKAAVFRKIEEAAITVVGFAGLLYASIWIYEIGSIFLGNDTENQEQLVRRMTGIYAFGYWLQPLLYILLSQLVRLPKIANHFFSRFIIAFFLFLNFEKFVIVVTSLHRDYLPSSWTMYGGYSIFGWIIADWILKLIIFSSLVTVAFYLKNRKTL
jgi:hypothetical protein